MEHSTVEISTSVIVRALSGYGKIKNTKDFCGAWLPTSHQEGTAMEPPCEDTMPELSESFRKLADSSALWARLVGTFYNPIHIPPMPDERGENQQA
jgi:hypothetical protein